MAFASMVLLAALAIVLFVRPNDGAAEQQGFAGAIRPQIPPRTWILKDQDGRRCASARRHRGRAS